jgi:nicotinamide riboside kinase
LVNYLVFTGPESSGKSTLASWLANSHDLPLVNEYAREYLTTLSRKYILSDLDKIAKGQQFLEHLGQNKIIICDTDLLTLYIWKLEVFGLCDLHMAETISSYKNRFYLLCKPDIPWEEDPLRENPLDRNRLFDVYQEHLSFFDLDYLIIEGDLQTRHKTISNFMDSSIGNRFEL